MSERMLDWSKLSDAYGSATAVPGLLAALDPEPEAEVWDELISRLCHQGSTYSASYPALTYLLAAVERWPASARITPLCLAASILASDDTDTETRTEHADTQAALRRWAQDTLDSLDLAYSDVVWLQQAFLQLSSERVWGPSWDRLLDGELSGVCPACGEDLYLVIGDEGFFATSEDWVMGADVRKSPIQPAPIPALEWPGTWLLANAQQHAQPLLERQVLHAFGTSCCPACDATFEMGDALRGA